MDYDSDPRLTNVSGKVKKLEREYDDIIWEEGPGDPRLVTLTRELRYYKKLQEQGILHEPNF